ncbi:MAG: hypothetical protein AAF563_12405 [Pseudomonadota bacterium]
MSGEKKDNVWYNPSLTEEERRDLDQECQEFIDLLKDVPDKKNKPTLDVGFEAVHPFTTKRVTAFRQWWEEKKRDEAEESRRTEKRDGQSKKDS